MKASNICLFGFGFLIISPLLFSCGFPMAGIVAGLCGIENIIVGLVIYKKGSKKE